MRATRSSSAAASNGDVKSASVEPSPKKRKVGTPKKKPSTKEPPPPVPNWSTAPPDAVVPDAERTVWSAAMRPEAYTGSAKRFISWNVAGLRGLQKKDVEAISRLAEQEQASVICIQEHKLQDANVPDVQAKLGLEDWHFKWSCSQAKKGYSGTAVMCRDAPARVSEGIGAPEHDAEGRVVTVELEDVYLVNVYVPNSGAGLVRLEYRITEWDLAFAKYVKGLEARKPVVVTGDLNCAHRPIDIWSPKTNLKSAGFTPQERASFQEHLLGGGLVDTFREQYGPGAVAYTYWGYRGKDLRGNNKGWRLDYFLVSEVLRERCHDSYMVLDQMGSDHCPIVLVLKD